MIKLFHSIIATPLGPMVAIGDERALYLLEFADQRFLQCRIEDLLRQIGVPLFTSKTDLFLLLEQELKTYFKGETTTFKTPVVLLGTPFQKQVWEQLQHIPFGQTRSYSAIARVMGNERAVRAVGTACGANRIALLIPCHRVIKADKTIGAYAGGSARKESLLTHENSRLDILRNLLSKKNEMILRQVHFLGARHI